MKAREAIEDALKEIGVLDPSEAVDPEHVQFAMGKLGRMLSAWQNLGYSLWTRAEQTVTLTTAGTYTLSPVRPARILSVRMVRSGTELPMHEMTRQEYDDLPIKTTTGHPTSFYYDRQREAARLYIWPLLSTAAGETLKITYERAIERPTKLSDEVDVPVEFEHAMVLGLAAELAPAFSRMPPPAAAASLMVALAADREGSVFFTGECGCGA